MRIGVVSDTHMPLRGKQLPRALVEGLHGVDLILHAGDWTSLDAVSQLETIAPVDGVAGNNDGRELVKRFSRKKIIEVAGVRIGIVHGDDGYGGPAEFRAFEAFRDEGVDIIVFGHSHTPHISRKDGILLFNPGSAMDKRWEAEYSFGIIEISKEITARHVYYEKNS